MRVAANLLIGLLFGIGLVLSGMSNPAKVLNFLDLTGSWDPSLLLVMAGAVLVAFVGFRLVLSRQRPVMEPVFRLPSKAGLDRQLLMGASVFGVGWGLSGLCPGPAFTALGLGSPGILAFVGCMMLGIWTARRLRDSGSSVVEA